MKVEIIRSAKTIEGAIDVACKELNLSRDDVLVEVVSTPKKGFLGLGQMDAQVKVTYYKSDVSKIDIAKKYLSDVLTNMGIENFSLEVNEKTDRDAVIVMKGENLGIAIGKRGDTLNALQQLCSIAANRSGGVYYGISLDVGNYREKREMALKDLARKVAHSVLHSGRKVTLEPMTPYERKIIHETVQNIGGVNSESYGKEPHRYIVVVATNRNGSFKNKVDNKFIKRYSETNNKQNINENI